MSFFIDPCGTSYIFLENEVDFHLGLLDCIQKSGFQKFRLVVENWLNMKKELEITLKGLEKDWKIEPYATTFLGFDMYGGLNTDSINENFETLEVQVEDISSLAVVKNFIITSFGYDTDNQIKPNKIEKIAVFFDKLENIKNWQRELKIYLVQEKNTNLWVGCYALMKIGNEIQLHSVAGKANGLKLVQESKLPILFQSATLKSMQLGGKNLTFSSSQSKLVEKYTNLGCSPIKTRKCWLVEKKPSS